MLQAGHYDPDAVRACAETVALHWQTLMLKMEDRLKLVNASVAFYKTSEQVQCVKAEECVSVAGVNTLIAERTLSMLKGKTVLRKGQD